MVARRLTFGMPQVVRRSGLEVQHAPDESRTTALPATAALVVHETTGRQKRETRGMRAKPSCSFAAQPGQTNHPRVDPQRVIVWNAL